MRLKALGQDNLIIVLSVRLFVSKSSCKVMVIKGQALMLKICFVVLQSFVLLNIRFPNCDDSEVTLDMT